MTSIQTHPLDMVPIRGGHEEEVKSLLRLLPENPFEYTRQFVRGIPIHSEEFVGQIGLYARKEPVMGDRAISLIAVNEHLFGDPTSPGDNPLFRVPEGARNIDLVSPRMPPLISGHPFMGVEFDYKSAKYFFGYELSPKAVDTIKEYIKRE